MAFWRDILSQKRRRLDSYVSKFSKAVSLITRTIENLRNINRNITETIQEIDEYQQELAETKSGLADAMEKNEKVIANFQALLSV